MGSKVFEIKGESKYLTFTLGEGSANKMSRLISSLLLSFLLKNEIEFWKTFKKGATFYFLSNAVRVKRSEFTHINTFLMVGSGFHFFGFKTSS